MYNEIEGIPAEAVSSSGVASSIDQDKLRADKAHSEELLCKETLWIPYPLQFAQSRPSLHSSVPLLQTMHPTMVWEYGFLILCLIFLT